MEKYLFLAAEGEPHWALVCLIGISVVFVGLAILIGLIELINVVTTKLEKKKPVEQSNANTEAPARRASRKQENSPAEIENRDEIVAAVCAAVAEENGTDISAIRVVSFKRV